jgi:hypothetical protein
VAQAGILPSPEAVPEIKHDTVHKDVGIDLSSGA